MIALGNRICISIHLGLSIYIDPVVWFAWGTTLPLLEIWMLNIAEYVVSMRGNWTLRNITGVTGVSRPKSSSLPPYLFKSPLENPWSPHPSSQELFLVILLPFAGDGIHWKASAVARWWSKHARQTISQWKEVWRQKQAAYDTMKIVPGCVRMTDICSCWQMLMCALI